MCVSIHYCYANIRSKFMKIGSRWRNIFQSGVIYHNRRRQSNLPYANFSTSLKRGKLFCNILGFFQIFSVSIQAFLCTN